MIALASDHVGLALKREIARLLEERGLAYRDFGTGDETRCDYPVFGARVVGGDLARMIVSEWLDTPYEGAGTSGGWMRSRSSNGASCPINGKSTEQIRQKTDIIEIRDAFAMI